MKFSKLILVTFVGLSLIASKCYKDEEIENRILIENKLNKTIYVVPGYNYPDTTLGFTSKESILANKTSLMVFPQSNKRITNLSLCYKNEWNRLVPTDTLFLFVFDKKVVDNESWETITNNYMVLKRYKITFSDLASDCEFTVQ